LYVHVNYRLQLFVNNFDATNGINILLHNIGNISFLFLPGQSQEN
jgi:hypothetical protein